MPRLLVIDNYDSFTFNLVQMFRSYPLAIEVRRSDQITVAGIGAETPDYILISPGPRDPAHAGVSMSLIRAFYRDIPILGVCLGMQCMNEAFGGKTVRAPLPMHGKTSVIRHEMESVFKGLPPEFTAARYHSLMVRPPDPLNGYPLRVAARAEDGVIMGLYHPERPLHGVQFHPESFLTDHGFLLVENFLSLGPLSHDINYRQNNGTYRRDYKN